MHHNGRGNQKGVRGAFAGLAVAQEELRAAKAVLKVVLNCNQIHTKSFS